MKKTLCWMMFSLAAIGCGAVSPSELESDELVDLAEQSDEISTTKDTHVWVRRDQRKCISPLCGGYWLKDVHGLNSERYVNSFDFTRAKFDSETQDAVTGAGDGDLILVGRLGKAESRFNTRPFLVRAAYRGLPGNKRKSTDLAYFFELTGVRCIAAPCPIWRSTKVNYPSTKATFDGLEIAGALKANVDAAWLENRIRSQSAIVTGKRISGAPLPTGTPRSFQVSQIFLKLPEPRCAIASLMPCPQADQVHTWERTEEGCLMPAGCRVPDANCPVLKPYCDPGYALMNWTQSSDGCNIGVACDPEFATHW